MMSKKHYIQIAQMFKQKWEATEFLSIEDDSQEMTQAVIEDIVESMIELFQDDNPAFDRNRFLNACGLTSK